MEDLSTVPRLSEADLIPMLRNELNSARIETSQAYTIAEQRVFGSQDVSHLRLPRASQQPFSEFYMQQPKKRLRTCQNLRGILGGSNAFHFLSFVAGVATLVINVNNNINNNNNNLNGINANGNSQNSNNGNVNNNAANIIIVMPGKRRKRSSSQTNPLKVGADVRESIDRLPAEVPHIALDLMELLVEYASRQEQSSCSKDFSCGILAQRHFGSFAHRLRQEDITVSV